MKVFDNTGRRTLSVCSGYAVHCHLRAGISIESTAASAYFSNYVISIYISDALAFFLLIAANDCNRALFNGHRNIGMSISLKSLYSKEKGAFACPSRIYNNGSNFLLPLLATLIFIKKLF